MVLGMLANMGRRAGRPELARAKRRAAPRPRDPPGVRTCEVDVSRFRNRRFPFFRRSIFMRRFTSLLLAFALVCSLAIPASADIFYFSTGEPDGLMAVASHPAGTYTDENEAADDFTLDSETLLIGATFYGLLPYDSSPEDIGDVIVEIYRVFPNDSDPDREIQVPTRANSPSDVAFDSRAASEGRGTPI